jgi:hypothetical protein
MNIEALTNKENPTQKELKVIAKAFWNLTKKYELTHEDIITILGKKFDHKTIQKFKTAMELPEGHDFIMRAIHVLGIHNSLRIIYPHNDSLVYSWMKSKDRDLKNFSPIELIKESGIKSLSAIIFLRNQLDYKITAL